MGDTCTKQGVFEARKFNGVTKMYLKRTLVVMATNFSTKIVITRITKEMRNFNTKLTQ